VRVGALAGRELRDGVALFLVFGAQEPLGREQALHAHRPAGVNSPRGDANLGSESEAEAVGESGGRVDEDAGGVDPAREGLLRLLGFGHDALRVRGAVRVNVGHGGLGKQACSKQGEQGGGG